jgi:hypothetical protein
MEAEPLSRANAGAITADMIGSLKTIGDLFG